MNAPNVEVARAEQRLRVESALMLAFVEDPFARWMFPRADEFLERYRQFMSGMGGRAFEHGTAFQVADCAAAALWLPPNVTPDMEAIMTLLGSVGWLDAKVADLGGLAMQVETYHPRESHWYLAVLGADVAYQGNGLGSLLMKHALALCDRDRLPAYLESSNPANVPFYRRHGFEVMGQIESGSVPVITPMLRSAR